MDNRFLLRDGLLHFNHGSFGATPREVLAHQRELLNRMEEQPMEFFMQDLAGLWAHARTQAAQFLGASPDDFVFVRNATEGANAVLGSAGLGPGDEVLCTVHRYPAVKNAVLRECARTGAVPINAPVPFPCPGPEAILDAVDAAWTDRTKLLVIDHISSATALVFPVEELCARARERGVPVFVDGAHVPGHLEVDVPSLGATWWCGNFHKWALAPKAAAGLWVHPEAQDQTIPPVVGNRHGMGFQEEFSWQGTEDPTAFLSVPRGLEVFEAWGGFQTRSQHHARLLEARETLAKRWGVELPNPASMNSLIATIPLPRTVPLARSLDLQKEVLRRHGVQSMFPGFDDRLWCRIAWTWDTTPEHVDRLGEAVLDCVG